MNAILLIEDSYKLNIIETVILLLYFLAFRMPSSEDKPASFIGKLCNILRVTIKLSSLSKTVKSSAGILMLKVSVFSIKKDYKKPFFPVILGIIDTPRLFDNSICMIFIKFIYRIIGQFSYMTPSIPKSIHFLT